MYHVGSPNIGDLGLLGQYLEQITRTKRLSNNGPLVKEFESRVADLTCTQHAIAVSNATLGIQLAAKALNLNGEVIVPSFTFVGTVYALTWLGLKPIFVDIDPDTHNIDPNLIERSITDSTSAILAVHLWGRACNTQQLKEIGSRHNIHVIYDAAHAFLCSENEKIIGSNGTCEIFSFHATKFLNCFEGGVITTNDGTLANQLRLLSNFGFEAYDCSTAMGINAKMSEISAAMGLTSLNAKDKIINHNQQNYHHYAVILGQVAGIKLIDYNPASNSNYQYIVLEVDENIYGTTRDALCAKLHKAGVLARKYFSPGCHQQISFKDHEQYQTKKLPHTDELCSKVLCLPTGLSIGLLEIEEICKIISNPN